MSSIIFTVYALHYSIPAPGLPYHNMTLAIRLSGPSGESGAFWQPVCQGKAAFAL
jgi:hypothetical protein